jgi:hypothetical protein
VHHNHSPFHDKHGVFGGVNVLEHVARHCDDVGALADFECAGVAVNAEQFGRFAVPARRAAEGSIPRSVSRPNSIAFIPCGETPESVPKQSRAASATE